jgi:hypothetical protein
MFRVISKYSLNNQSDSTWCVSRRWTMSPPPAKSRNWDICKTVRHCIALHCLPGKSAAVLHFVRALCGLKKGYIHVPGTETNPNISSFVTSHDSLWILASKPACNTVQACHFSLRRASKCSLESLKEHDVSSKHYAKKCVYAPCHQCRRLVGIASWYCINCIAYI